MDAGGVPPGDVCPASVRIAYRKIQFKSSPSSDDQEPRAHLRKGAACGYEGRKQAQAEAVKSAWLWALAMRRGDVHQHVDKVN